MTFNNTNSTQILNAIDIRVGNQIESLRVSKQTHLIWDRLVLALMAAAMQTVILGSFVLQYPDLFHRAHFLVRVHCLSHLWDSLSLICYPVNWQLFYEGGKSEKQKYICNVVIISLTFSMKVGIIRYRIGLRGGGVTVQNGERLTWEHGIDKSKVLEINSLFLWTNQLFPNLLAKAFICYGELLLLLLLLSSFRNARSKAFHKHGGRDSHCITGLLPSVCSEMHLLAQLQFIKVDIEWRRISFPVFNYFRVRAKFRHSMGQASKERARYFVSIHINLAENVVKYYHDYDKWSIAKQFWSFS